MPDELRCEELDKIINSWTKEDMNFVMWILSAKYADSISTYEKYEKLTSDQFMIDWYKSEVKRGLKMLNEVLTCEW